MSLPRFSMDRQSLMLWCS